MEDCVNIFVWFMCSEKPDEFKESFGDFFGAIDFQGEKLTSDGKAENKKWFRALRTVHQDFYEFIKSQHPKIMKWTGSADKAEDVYKGFMGSLGSAAPVAEAPKAEPKKEEAKAPAKAAPAKPAKPAPKAPVKVLRFKTWEVSNYGAETLVFPAAEVNAGMTFNFFNCEKTKVVIEGKYKNAMLSRCKNMDIKMDECMSMMEVIKSENIKVYVNKKCPSISIELCNGVQVITTAESKTQCQLTTTAS